jgi:hypothetical protein
VTALVYHVWTVAIWDERTGEARIEVWSTSGAAHQREKELQRAGKVVDVKARRRVRE